MARKGFLEKMRLGLDPEGRTRFGWMWGEEERTLVGLSAEVQA